VHSMHANGTCFACVRVCLCDLLLVFINTALPLRIITYGNICTWCGGIALIDRGVGWGHCSHLQCPSILFFWHRSMSTPYIHFSPVLLEWKRSCHVIFEFITHTHTHSHIQHNTAPRLSFLDDRRNYAIRRDGSRRKNDS
jgi:hypothetical protein